MFKKIALFVTLLFIISTVSEAEAATGSKIKWQYNYAEALKEAKETGKPLLLDFWATWCGPCKSMEVQVWTLDNVIEASDKFICVKVDIDQNPPLASLYKADSIPNIVFTDPWGNELTRNIGFTKANDMVRMMNWVPADYSEVKPYYQTLEKDGKNGQALAAIGAFYRRVGVGDISNRYYERALKTDAVKNSCELKEDALIGMGLNYIKLKQFAEAKKIFEKHLKEVPEGSQCDKAMLGLVTSLLFQNKVSEAEKMLEQLKSKYPNSEAAQQAAQNVQNMKNSK